MSEWILEVSDLNEYVRAVLGAEPALRKVRLRGEISNFKRHSTGHWYFTLKDARCRISAVMFRQNAMRMSIRPQDGMSVIVTGQVSLYSEGGTYQIYCDAMRPEGVGTLYQQYEALKRRLSEEGLFDAAHKRKLPWRPKKIAIVTSETGAVYHDIRKVSAKRDPGVPLVLLPVQVQGQGAAEEVARAIRKAGTLPDVDVIITGRGGGSMEDLWAFNEEAVARAIYDSPVPVISAVGHETDVTIADFVADVRASTPSNAAELAVPDREETLAGLEGVRAHLSHAMDGRLQQAHLRLARLRQRAVQSQPENRLMVVSARLMALRHRLNGEMDGHLTALMPRVALAQMRLDNAADLTLRTLVERVAREKTHLMALSPDRILERGYAIVTDGRSVLPDRATAQTRTSFTLRFRDGEMRVRKEKDDGDEEETEL